MYNKSFSFFDIVNSVLDKRDGWVSFVLLDCQKPFDFVPHRKLGKELVFWFGIREILFGWSKIIFLEANRGHISEEPFFLSWVYYWHSTRLFCRAVVTFDICLWLTWRTGYLNTFVDDAKVRSEDYWGLHQLTKGLAQVQSSSAKYIMKVYMIWECLNI